LTEEVNDELTSEWPEDSDEALQMAAGNQFIESFMLNYSVTASYSKSPKTDFRRLQSKSKKSPYIWEIRTGPPITKIRRVPGIRIIGAFSEADCFIGLGIEPRDTIDFEVASKRAMAKWVSLFSPYNPILSEDINDYIKENVVRL